MEELRSKIKTLFLEISKSLKIFDLENIFPSPEKCVNEFHGVGKPLCEASSIFPFGMESLQVKAPTSLF